MPTATDSPLIFPPSASVVRTPLTALPAQRQTAITESLKMAPADSLDWLEPETVEDLQAIIESTYHHQQALLPCGNASKLSWGGLGNPVNAIVSSRCLNQVLDYAPADMTLTVEAGVTLSEIQTLLQENQHFLPLNPLFQDQTTAGGIMATGTAGSWQQRYGGVRDLILGFSFVRQMRTR